MTTTPPEYPFQRELEAASRGRWEPKGPGEGHRFVPDPPAQVALLEAPTNRDGAFVCSWCEGEVPIAGRLHLKCEVSATQAATGGGIDLSGSLTPRKPSRYVPKSDVRSPHHAAFALANMPRTP